MQRPIKFRAWGGKRMIEWEEYQQDNLAPWKTISIDNFPLVHMQYTGLHDKNGKDCYEGDILRFDERIGNVVVVWKFDGFTLESRKYSESKENYERRSLSNATRLEIIGNIYENPEFTPSSK